MSVSLSFLLAISMLTLAEGIMDGHWIDLEQAFATGRVVAPSRTCQFQLDEDKGSRKDFVLACPIAMAAAAACRVLPDRWFVPHFAVFAESALSAWDATVERARVYSRLWPACWLTCSDRSRRSPSHAVQNIWDVEKLALFLGRLGRSSLLHVTPLTLMRLGVCGAVNLRRALLVLISLLVGPPFRILVVMWVEAKLSIYTMRLGGRVSRSYLPC